MGGLVLLLVGYVIGGLSFIPLLTLFLWIWGTRNKSNDQAYATTALQDKDADAYLSDWGAGLGEDLLRELKAKHVPDVASGFFAIRREYVPGGVPGKPPDRTTSATGAVSALESPSVYQSMYRSIFDRSRNIAPTLSPSSSQKKNKKTLNVFFVVLRLGHLMLYDDAEQLEVRHVISLNHYSISVYAGGEDIPEGELWIKRNCIRLAPKDSASVVGDTASLYFFSDNCSEKEDFYHAMLRSQEGEETDVKSSEVPPPPLKFEPSDLIKLVQQLHASEENLHTRWINALIGRLFLAMYKTKHIESYIWTKITKKIDRVQKPGLISSVKVQKLDMGDLPPFLTNPRLKELTVDGDLTVEADVSYKGNFRIDISAVARIELGSRFKPREVTFILATILNALEGHVLIRIKPPPSNRIWVTFESPPQMNLSLEPIVSSRQITYGVILRAIESRIREVVNETLVYPNWDDIPFSSTQSHQFRGGIWREEFVAGHALLGPKPSSLTSHVQSRPEDVHMDVVPVSNSTYSSSNDSAKSLPALSLNTPYKRFPVQPRTSEESSGLFTPMENPQDDTSSAVSSSIAGSIEPRSTLLNTTSMQSSSSMHDGDSAFLRSKEYSGKTQVIASMREGARGSLPSSQSDSTALHRPIAVSGQKSNGLTEWPHVPSSDHDRVADTSNQVFEDTPATPPGLKTTPTSASSTGQPKEVASVQRRPTLNQSLTSATTAAKKWLTTRQNTSPGGGTGNLHVVRSEGNDVLAATQAQGVSRKNGHQLRPIGRGQPLPPPGTPLPHPPKSDRRGTWSAQTASVLVNLARRGPSNAKTTTALPSPGSPAEIGGLDLQGLDRSDASAAKDEVASTTPPPLPKRRQRTSILETNDDRNNEEILVVEAPAQETTISSGSISDSESKFSNEVTP